MTRIAYAYTTEAKHRFSTSFWRNGSLIPTFSPSCPTMAFLVLDKDLQIVATDTPYITIRTFQHLDLNMCWQQDCTQ